MPRKQPPPGYLTPAQAQEILGPMLYKYVKRGVIKRYTPPYGSYGYYKRSDVEELKRSREVFYQAGPLSDGTSEEREQHQIEFAIATPADMEGVYNVAAELFGHTTSAEARKPLVALCPEGNYIVRDNGQIMAYIHIQPLKPDRMKAFLNGEIRGSQIRADDLECFTPGKPTDVLIKSVGAIGQGKWPKHYIQRLVIGAVRDLGSKGINLTRIYATSETETGIAMSIHAEMTSLGKIGKNRYAFMLDVSNSTLPMLQIYKRAYAEWQVQHAPVKKPAQATHAPPRSEQKTTGHYTPPSHLPAGTITLNQLAEELGVNRSTLYEQVRDNELDHIAIPLSELGKAGAGQERFFTPEQAQAVRDWRATRPNRKRDRGPGDD